MIGGWKCCEWEVVMCGVMVNEWECDGKIVWFVYMRIVCEENRGREGV